MVNAGRVACVTTPFLLSLAALACLVLVFLAGTIEHNDTFGNWYFMKINLQNLTTTAADTILDNYGSSIPNTTTSAATLSNILNTAKTSHGMRDYYTIYLRTQCSWNSNEKPYSHCTSPQSYFWFNPIEVWHLNDTAITSTAIDTILPKTIKTGLKTYHQASRVTFTLYCASLAATAGALLIGITAIFSRWGSFFTIFFAGASGLLFVSASTVATTMFYLLRTALNNTLKKDYGVDTTVGSQILTISWIGSAFAAGSIVFWLFSVCCCSGRSPYNPGSREARRTRAEKTPYTYERVGSPYLGPQDGGRQGGGFGQGQDVQMHTFQQRQPGYGGQERNAAYEPFRPQQV